MVEKLTIVELDTWFVTTFISQRGTYYLAQSDILKLRKLTYLAENKIFKINLSSNGEPTTGWHFVIYLKPTFYESGWSGGRIYFTFYGINNQIVRISMSHTDGVVNVSLS